MKRLLHLLLIALFSVSMVTGCASMSGTSQDSAAYQSTVSAVRDNTAVHSAVDQNSTAETQAISTNPGTNTKGYHDGVYEGKSPLTSELYYGKALITIKNGSIANVDFTIYDAGQFKNSLPIDKTKDIKEMVLDEQYGKLVFANSELYQQQCVNELAGIKKYNSMIVEKQDVDKIDAVSGATWSLGLYKQAMKDALKKAANK